MANALRYDVFLAHASRDAAAVGALAERLRKDGVRVWFDGWLKPGADLDSESERALARSRVLVLCITANVGDEWPRLESQTFRFRDPANRERQFIPLRLDESQLRGSLAQLVAIDWFGAGVEKWYGRLRAICRSGRLAEPRQEKARKQQRPSRIVRLAHRGQYTYYAFTRDKRRVLAGCMNSVVLFDSSTGEVLRTLDGHKEDVWSVAWDADERRALSASADSSIRLWDMDSGTCERVFEGHTDRVNMAAWSPDERKVLSAGLDRTVRLWDVDTGACLRVLEGHTDAALGVAWSRDGRRALSCGSDGSIRLWNVDRAEMLGTFHGHLNDVWTVLWTRDERRFLSVGEQDKTVRLWNVLTGSCERIFEGHTGLLWTATLSSDERYAVSGCYYDESTVRIWDLERGTNVRSLRFPAEGVRFTAWMDEHTIVAGGTEGDLYYWDVADLAIPHHQPEQIQYTNAKVLLVGESGAGKTGLSHRLASNDWQPSDSTVGAWATQWKLSVSSRDTVEREIWLWDFGGQADQRLIHQLYMAETAVAVLVFDGQKEDLFETLAQWDRDLTRAAGREFAKVLVAGRVDAGGLRVSRSQIDAFVREHGFAGFVETSAKSNTGCEELRRMILDAIQWENIPWRSSPVLFKRLKDEIVRLKEDGRVLMRFNELRDALKVRASDDAVHFTADELKAVVGLLAGPGIVWELKFGSWILLQPERINAYAQAVIQTLRLDDLERGCLVEERVLRGDLIYHSSISRLPAEEERFVLLAMHQTLVERGLCMREQTDKGTLLVFPSYYRRERPPQEEHPSVMVTYRFDGFLDEIYATLVVRLHHTDPFTQDSLWRYAADFRTATGHQLGIKLTRRAEGTGELDVYFGSTVTIEEKILFSRYVHEHLLQNAQNVVRLRHYVCPNCGTPVKNHDVARRRLAQGMTDILCVYCEERIPLMDELEELFASDAVRKKVNELQEQSAIVLDNESQERALVGEVISTVALAGQISRERAVSEHGIDMEIEFVSSHSEPTGQQLLLQLKVARRRTRDGAEVCTLAPLNARHLAASVFPVMLVIRTADGEIQWMDVRASLRKAAAISKHKPVQIRFSGERLDVMSVRRWRDTMLVDVDDSAFEREKDETRRADALRRLMALAPDDKTRDLFLRVISDDTSALVRGVAYDALCQRWWKEAAVRAKVRERIAVEQGDAREHLLRAITEGRASLARLWEARLSGVRVEEHDPEALPGYPAFRVLRFRLRNIGPFEDTGEIALQPDVNVFLGDNAAGKTTLLRCLALAAIGLPAANEVEDDAGAYLRKGTRKGTIEALIQIVPDPGALDEELGQLRVGLQIRAGSSRFAPMAVSEMTLGRSSRSVDFPNSVEKLGGLRSRFATAFGFVAGYGAVRSFGESRNAIQLEHKKRENEWVLSLFNPETWLVNPEVFTKLLRGDTSNIEDAPAGGLSQDMSETLRKSLQHLFPEVNRFFGEGDDDLLLNGVRLRFGEMSDGYRSLFALMGHLLRCALKARNWNGDPTTIDAIALIDEMDLHLHPAWQTHVVQDFRRAFGNVQLIVSTHSALVVAALKREQVLIMRREEHGAVSIEHPDADPQGLGVAGILTTIFDLGSTIDQPTLDKITHRILLYSMREKWTPEQKQEYEQLTEDLARLGFNREFSDPYFERFATAMARRHQATVEQLSPKEREDLDAYADELLASIANEDTP